MTIKNGMRAIHPGEMLREEFMKPLDLSANALANALGVTAARVNEIAKETRGITADAALRLAQYFGDDAHSWMNLQSEYDLKTTERKIGSRYGKSRGWQLLRVR